MAITSPIVAPPVAVLTEAVMLEQEQVRPPLPEPPPSPDQVQAVEAVFAAREEESQQVASLLGLWTSVALMHDLAVDSFAAHGGPVEPEDERKRRLKEQQRD